MQMKPRAATPAVMMQLMMLKAWGTGRGKTPSAKPEARSDARRNSQEPAPGGNAVATAD
jgi:hypothetical protein